MCHGSQDRGTASPAVGDDRVRAFAAAAESDLSLLVRLTSELSEPALVALRRAALSRMTQEQARRTFATVDVDKNGVLSLQEFESWLAASRVHTQRVGTRGSVMPRPPGHEHTRTAAAILAAAAATPPDAPGAEARTPDSDSAAAQFQERLLAAAALPDPAPRPSNRQLRFVALRTCVPFIGFGFLDNAIMLVAGDAIDSTLGSVLGISVLAAAALGNLVSDIAGLGASGAIERLADKLGLPDPGLTMAQSRLSVVHRVSVTGSVAGITIGCLLGMAPLLFMDHEPAAAAAAAAAAVAAHAAVP